MGREGLKGRLLGGKGKEMDEDGYVSRVGMKADVMRNLNIFLGFSVYLKLCLKNEPPSYLRAIISSSIRKFIRVRIRFHYHHHQHH